MCAAWRSEFDLGGGTTTDLVMISAPMFFVQTPALFVEFLQTVGSGDKAKLDAFFAAHPESTRQAGWLNSHAIPASYAGVDYWGVHAFTFTNAKGETALVKYKAIPDAGELGLTDDEAKAKGDNFYENEMKDRLAKGPVSFELVAIRGKDGDPTNDPTLRWDDQDLRETTRSARSASMRSRLQRPAMRSPSCRGTWSMASPGPPTTLCSWRARPPTYCPSSSASNGQDQAASGPMRRLTRASRQRASSSSCVARLLTHAEASA